LSAVDGTRLITIHGSLVTFLKDNLTEGVSTTTHKDEVNS
jgi:hypothetical protein